MFDSEAGTGHEYLEIAAQIQERDEMILLDVGIFVDEGSEFETHHCGIFEFQNLGENREYVSRRSLLVAEKRSTADLVEKLLKIMVNTLRISERTRTSGRVRCFLGR